VILLALVEPVAGKIDLLEIEQGRDGLVHLASVLGGFEPDECTGRPLTCGISCEVRCTLMKMKGLGELALRVNDFARMRAFYRDVVGLEVFDEPEPFFVFFKTGEGVEGHPQIFALFDRNAEVSQEHSALDHFAFLIELEDYEAEHERLTSLGIDVFTTTFPHFHFRSLFFSDPEGNTVEFVCYDPSV
jgi:catechol 2,3-dioxygenase